MNIIGFFAHHKVAANLLMILMIVSGLYALAKLNVQFFPSFELDRISVRVIWPGASAEDIEQGITTPLEQSLKTVENLDKITSTSAQNISSILMEFTEDSDLLVALDKVKQKVDEYKNLPQDAEKPIVQTIVRYENVATVQISQNPQIKNQQPFTSRELGQLVDNFEKELIQRGIDKVTINGLPEQEIAIELSTEKLYQLKMNLADVAKKVGDYSLDLPIGVSGANEHGKELRTLEQGKTIEAYKNIPIVQTTTELIQLGDIATIVKRDRTGEVARLSHNRPVVEMVLQRTEKGNALVAAEIMQQWLKDKSFELPPNIQLIVYDETWRLIKERTMLLVQNGLGGLILVVAILYLFLNGKVAMWVAIGIPISFMATLAILY
ncbi:MAG: efflux RND transporter permease subunit, partial [Gammaproteobacteria bacterium]|nr:efflux RND transporter permease subunit [Gammaproteobacteria bacterium]